MAISFISSHQLQNSNLPSGAHAFTYSPASTAGDSLILTGDWYNNNDGVAQTGIVSVTDSAGNTWSLSTSNSQKPPSVFYNTANQWYGSFVAWTLNAASISSVTINVNASDTSFANLVISEWSGIVSADNGGALSGASSQGTNLALPAINLTTPNELVIGASDGLSGVTSSNPPTGFSNLGGGVHFYNIISNTGLLSAQYTNWTNNSDYSIAVMGFSPSPLPVSPLQPARSSLRISLAGTAWRSQLRPRSFSPVPQLVMPVPQPARNSWRIAAAGLAWRSWLRSRFRQFISPPPAGGPPPTATLQAPSVLSVAASAGPDLGALWAAYLAAAYRLADLQNYWRMAAPGMRTDGTAGRFYSQMFVAQKATDDAYTAWDNARKRLFPSPPTN